MPESVISVSNNERCMLPAFGDSHINICAFTSSLPVAVWLQNVGFCSSLDVDYEQNYNDDAVLCLLSATVCVLSEEKLNF